ncbi:MAG TPA: WXG100 family type VII secretion target, partial [Mycobacterium sp.]|nr:WXG100 family type VII secretion target [Mycobacterium sp.]
MTVTISVVAGSQPDGLTAAATRMQASIGSLEAQIASQRQTLVQLPAAWQGAAADAAMARAQKNLQHQQELRIRLQAMQSALKAGGAQLSSLRTEILNVAAQATSLGGIVGDDGTVSDAGVGGAMTAAVAGA